MFTALVHPDNSLNSFLSYSNVDSWRVIEVQSSQNDNGDGAAIAACEVTEYLLVFQTLAIYVDQQGRRTRDREIMYPAIPTFISKFVLKLRLLCDLNCILFPSRSSSL